MTAWTIHIRVTGRVQGVGFRAFVRKRAQSAGLSGWVRNTEDGSVEAVISGDKAAVEALLSACREDGPGRVATVEIIDEPGPVTGPFTIERD